MVVSVSVQSIPQYLRNSAFAKAIENDDDDTIEVPDSCYKSDLTIKSNDDLSQLLGTLRFWGVDLVPREVIMYIIWKKPQEVLQCTGDYEKELGYLVFLQALCAKTALSCGERTVNYWGYSANYWGYSDNTSWSSDPAEAAAQVCLIHYANANGRIWTADTTALAARLGQQPALKFLREAGCPWEASTCSSAASRGHLSCLKYAHTHGCKWDADTCTEAAQHRHLSCLKYALDKGCPTDVKTLSWAVRHAPCYKFMCDKGLQSLDPALCVSAALTTNLSLLRKLRDQGCPWDEGTCAAAAEAGSLACLTYAHENGCPWDSRTPTRAAEHGNLGCLRYAVEHQCALSADLIARAAPYIVCLQYLHQERGVPWLKEVCQQATFGSNVDSLQYAHEQGCPWDARTCEAAARWGKLAALRYAHEQGCPWDARTVNAAAAEGNYSCLEYALARRCPADHTTCTRAAAASRSCLMLAREHGCTWDPETCAAAAQAGKLGCLKYLFEQGCPRDATTAQAAVRAGKLDCLKYARKNGCPWVVAQLLAIPLTVQSRRCLEYVRDEAPAEAEDYDESWEGIFGDTYAVCAPPETKHQRYVRRWQEKQARQVQARAKGGKRTAAAQKHGQARAGRS
jgi:hypothetical protein